MLRFRRMKTLQKFISAHASIHNHFNSERQLVDRQTYKTRRSAALAECQNIAACKLVDLACVGQPETSCDWSDSTARSLFSGIPPRPYNG